MAEPLGSYAPQTPKLEPDVYDAQVVKCAVVMDGHGIPTLNQSGKNQIDVTFRVDEDNAVRRRFAISFGKNSQTGKHAALAEFIAAATGIACGDPAQRDVLAEHLVGKRVRVVIALSEDGQYSNVESVLPIKGTRASTAPAPAGTSPAGHKYPKPLATPRSRSADGLPEYKMGEDEEQVPF